MILFFKDEEALQAFVNKNGNHRHIIPLIGHPSELQKEIRAIETERQLDGSKCYDQIWTDTHSRRVYPLEYRTRIVMYYNQVGYMKYGMDGSFFDDFIQCKNYFKKTDILKAATYVCNDSYNEDNIENFQRDFVDSFEEGKSVFYYF